MIYRVDVMAMGAGCLLSLDPGLVLTRENSVVQRIIVLELDLTPKFVSTTFSCRSDMNWSNIHDQMYFKY